MPVPRAFGARALGLVLLLALGVAAALPAAAAEEGHGEEPGLLTLDWKLTAVTIAVFVVLLFVLAKAAWKPILAGLQKREDTIRKALDEAAQANADAKALMAQYEQRLAKASEEAQAIVENGRKDGEELRARIERTAKENAEETLARARREIDQAARKAYDDVLRGVAGIATEAASRIVRERLDAEANTRLVDEVVKDFAAGRGRGGRAG